MLSILVDSDITNFEAKFCFLFILYTDCKNLARLGGPHEIGPWAMGLVITAIVEYIDGLNYLLFDLLSGSGQSLRSWVWGYCLTGFAKNSSLMPVPIYSLVRESLAC